MTDRRPTEEEDHAWLLARERGEPMPPIADARARRYGQLGALIVHLPAVPAGTVQRDGWEQAVLAAIDANPGEPAAPSPSLPAVSMERPRPSEPIAMPRRRRRMAATTVAALVMVASVGIVIFVRRDGGPEVREGSNVAPRPEHAGEPPQIPEVTRSMHVEQGRLGFDHGVQVRRSEIAVPHELRDGDTVTAGDRIRASVRTSTDAYLYLAFCAGHRLQLYPSPRGVRTRAGDLVVVPDGGGELVVDDHTGSEVLYLILSRGELSVADPQLAALVAGGDKLVDCGTSLDIRLMRSPYLPPPQVLRGESIPGNRASNSQAMVAADGSGIAIVRYRFIHVAER